jgi:excisionase family DNA binding protein
LLDAIMQLVDERVEAALTQRTADRSTPWLTLAEASDLLRVSERTIARLIKRGRFRTTSIGRRRLVHREELDAFMKAAAGEGTAPTVPPRYRGRSVDGSRTRA